MIELRNAVYQACAQDTTEGPVDHKRRCWTLVRSWRRWSEDYTSQFFELTQVCTQIRQEFRSMCLASTPKWIPIDSFESYTGVFHPDLEVADTLVLDMQRIAGKYAEEADLLDVFVYLSIYGNVACTFDTTYDYNGRGQSLLDLCPILTRSAEQAPTTNWREAALKLVSIIPKTTTKNLVVAVKLECKARGTERKRFEADLCSKLGLRSEGKWSVVIKYE